MTIQLARQPEEERFWILSATKWFHGALQGCAVWCPRVGQSMESRGVSFPRPNLVIMSILIAVSLLVGLQDRDRPREDYDDGCTPVATKGPSAGIISPPTPPTDLRVRCPPQ